MLRQMELLLTNVNSFPESKFLNMKIFRTERRMGSDHVLELVKMRPYLEELTIVGTRHVFNELPILKHLKSLDLGFIKDYKNLSILQLFPNLNYLVLSSQNNLVIESCEKLSVVELELRLPFNKANYQMILNNCPDLMHLQTTFDVYCKMFTSLVQMLQHIPNFCVSFWADALPRAIKRLTYAANLALNNSFEAKLKLLYTLLEINVNAIFEWIDFLKHDEELSGKEKKVVVEVERILGVQQLLDELLQ
ncbi:hypothetical protein P9112_001808 [Eukaryota sp. TZLM1-RC]